MMFERLLVKMSGLVQISRHISGICIHKEA